MNYLLFDDTTWENLLPLTYTRPVAEIRIGILTIKEKWDKIFSTECTYITQDYLNQKYSKSISNDNILINASVLPNNELISKIKTLSANQAIVKDDKLIAVRLDKGNAEKFSSEELFQYSQQELSEEIITVNYPWDIFQNNGKALQYDFDLITKGRKSEKLSSTVNVLGKENVFIEKGAKLEFVTLNATTGPIYIGKDAEVMEGAVIRGPFALGEHSAIKLSAKIYGPTTIGPHCKAGGEINNSVFFAYSNKGHDGFLGNAVLGEWCNIGADTNNSNLKNNYVEVKMWNYKQNKFIKTGLQFCGLIMGDHSKCGINTMFNTGTVVGVSANIFGDGFPRNFIPSFSWGGSQGFSEYSMPKVFEVVAKVMERRDLVLDEVNKNILNHVSKISEKYRNF